MKKHIALSVAIFLSALPMLAQKVGINTVTPLASFHVDLGDSLSNGVLFTGLQSTGGNFPSLGAGRRLMFYPGNASFRAGYVNSNEWDEGQVGSYSFASGFSTIARGDGSISMGVHNIAGGTISTAFGYRTIAKGYASLVAGMYNDSMMVADEFFPIAGTPLFVIGNGSDYTTRNNALVVFKNGNLLMKNPATVLVETGGLLAPANGAGTRMMWLPQKSAFRVGTVDNNNWDIDSIGTWSTAMGLSTKAKGRYSTAMGVQTTASGITATAMGYATKASGENSVSMGSVSIASGPVATAMGYFTSASGFASSALGVSTSARGYASAAMGYGSLSKGYGSVALGVFNDPILAIDEVAVNSTTPLFVIGNGDNELTRHNAMVVFKNGNLLMKNPATVLVETGGLLAPANGAGTRMMWLPQKSAFRVGTTDNNNWDIDSIGTWSTAMGLSTKAKGRYSTALGVQTTASGITATAMGYATKASGENSVSMGSVSIASGPVATAMGYFTSASGFASSALGVSTSARGYASAAMGYGSLSKGYGSVALGVFNDPILAIDEVAVNSTTPLFVIGNGDNELTRHNAMVVRKDGHVGIGTNAPVTFLHVDVGSSLTDGFLVDGDNYDYDATVPDLGDGSRMMFYPGKAAFRVGYIEGGTYWDNINVGQNSVAMGFNTKASGSHSVAMGEWTQATSDASFAAGIGPLAGGSAAGAFGWYTRADGFASFASGKNTKATGLHATSMGNETTASGENAIAIGYATKASGMHSTAMNSYTKAKGFSSTVVGIYNDSLLTADQTVIAETTPLFIVGNGDNNTDRNNALVVYKNGDTEINGNAFITNAATINGNADLNGFTQLGGTSPNIKMKKLTGTSAPSQNAWTNVAHGLTMSKIISVNIIMNVPGFVNLPPSYMYHAGYEYDYQIATSNIVVINSVTNSSNILSKAFTILIVYEE